ncbi:MAG TPA: hypothetical protein VFV95_04935, partial [Vicinamibacterales bacterium]|nr:hypothetical protein [Vicinamibacterales bacterium]
MSPLDAGDLFQSRHIGPSTDERDEMLRAVGAASLGTLIDEALPAAIRLAQPLHLPSPLTEYQYL